METVAVDVPNVGGLILTPTSYSQAQTVREIVEKLTKYPFQLCNTKEAFDGLVLEFISIYGQPNQPVGTLSEFYTENLVNHFFIKTPKGGIIALERHHDGAFVITEAIHEKNN